MKQEQQVVSIQLETLKFHSIKARNTVEMKIKAELLKIRARSSYVIVLAHCTPQYCKKQVQLFWSDYFHNQSHLRSYGHVYFYQVWCRLVNNNFCRC